MSTEKSMIIGTVLLMLFAVGCEEDNKNDTREFPDKFKRYTVTNSAMGAAFAEVADVNGDGHDDIVASMYGSDLNNLPGYTNIYLGSGDLKDWTEIPEWLPRDRSGPGSTDARLG